MTKSRDLANAATALNAVTAAELTYVDGVTSAIQTQIDTKAPSSTAVTLTGTQTLTNKTLTNPVIASVVNNTLTTAKGDLVTATAASTPARLAVGNDGEQIVADSSTSTGLRYQSNFAAGKNAIINGAFNVWQRGTSFTSPTSNSTYTADRWLTGYAVAPTTYAVSQQAFTAGTAPVAGYESQYFYRGTITTAGSNTAWEHKQRIEDVRTFAGQTVTLSFWAKADSSRTGRVFFLQNFGSGGSGNVYSTAYNISLTTSWTRFTQTVSIASVSGKTIGTGSYLEATIEQPSANGSVIDIWGVQVESGSVATAFQTATGTIQGELAACQRYFYFQTNGSGGKAVGMAAMITTTQVRTVVPFPVTMRTTPTAVVTSGSNYYGVVLNGTSYYTNSLSINAPGPSAAELYGTISAVTVGWAGVIEAADASASISFSAEL